MLDFINGIGNTAWAGIAGLVVAMLGGLAGWRGSKKHPTEVGQPLPPTDQTPYVLTELRTLRDLVDRRFDDSDRMQGRIYNDTQVIRDRHHRSQ